MSCLRTLNLCNVVLRRRHNYQIAWIVVSQARSFIPSMLGSPGSSEDKRSPGTDASAFGTQARKLFWESWMLCHGAAIGVGTSRRHYLLPPAFPLYQYISRRLSLKRTNRRADTQQSYR